MHNSQLFQAKDIFNISSEILQIYISFEQITLFEICFRIQNVLILLDFVGFLYFFSLYFWFWFCCEVKYYFKSKLLIHKVSGYAGDWLEPKAMFIAAKSAKSRIDNKTFEKKAFFGLLHKFSKFSFDAKDQIYKKDLRCWQ